MLSSPLQRAVPSVASLIGIHRINIDSESALLWGANWYLVFGLLPALLGLVFLEP